MSNFEKIQKIVATELHVDEVDIKPESSIQDDFGADSLDVVELIMTIEEAFGIEISDEDAENFKTIQDILTHLTDLGK